MAQVACQGENVIEVFNVSDGSRASSLWVRRDSQPRLSPRMWIDSSSPRCHDDLSCTDRAGV